MIRSNEELTPQTSALESLYGGQFYKTKQPCTESLAKWVKQNLEKVLFLQAMSACEETVKMPL